MRWLCLHIGKKNRQTALGVGLGSATAGVLVMVAITLLTVVGYGLKRKLTGKETAGSALVGA